MKTKISLSALLILVIALVIISCKKPDMDMSDDNHSSTPSLPDVPYKYKNSANSDLVALGRVLFYDKKLSMNNSVSCGSCHQQSKAFCDNQQFSTGVEDMRTSRNTPSIFAKTGSVFWDGRAGSLQELALAPIKNHIEMKFENLNALSKKLSGIDYYQTLFNKAFPGREIDSSLIRTALVEFLHNFDFSANKFTLVRAEKSAYTASEALGETVFFGKGRCAQCHHIEGRVFLPNDSTAPNGGYGFTDESHNIGLNTVYKDNGIGDLTHSSSMNGHFMIPALLNVEFTSPYMHDGRFKTLEEVVEHYNSGIQDHPNLDLILRDIEGIDSENFDEVLFMQKYDLNHNGNLDDFEMSQFKPARLGLSPSEKKGLVDFLKTLSDPTIFNDKKFSNPFVSR